MNFWQGGWKQRSKSTESIFLIELYCINWMHPGKSIDIIDIPDMNDKDVTN